MKIRKYHIVPLILLTCLLQATHLMGKGYDEEVKNLHILISSSEGVERAGHLNDLSYSYRRMSYDSTRRYAMLALDQALESDSHLEQAKAFKNLGIASYKANKSVDHTLELLNKSIRLARMAGNYSIQVSSINVIALAHLHSGQKKKALSFFYQASELHRQQIKKDDYQKGLILGNISQAHEALGNHEKSRAYCVKVMKYAEEHNFLKLYPIYASSYADHLVASGQRDSAVAVIEKAKNISINIEDRQSSIQLSLGLCHLYENSEQLEKALEIANKAHKESTKEQLHKDAGRAALMKIKLYRKLGRDKEALALSLSQYYDSKGRGLLNQQAEISSILSDLLSINGNYKEALRYADIEKELLSEVREQRFTDLIAEYEAKYESDLKQSEISALHYENRLKGKTNSRLFTLLFSSVALCCLTCVFFYRKKAAEYELATKNKELEKYIESNIQLEQFAHMASHDLRTPLRTVKGFAALLGDRAKEKLNDRELEYLQFIENGTDQMGELLRDLLHYSDSNSKEIVIEKIDCQELFKSVLTKFDSCLIQDDIAVHIEHIPSFISADVSKLHRAVSNLISNAIKFRSPDRPTVIMISGAEILDFHSFTITDNGIGIAESFIDQVFDPYKQLHCKNEYNGTGMGLTIAKKIINRHGGQIAVKSRVDVGTEISFTLPKRKNVSSLPVEDSKQQTNGELALA